jgi:RimJ/RimL family protein N-acetyltransferase
MMTISIAPFDETHLATLKLLANDPAIGRTSSLATKTADQYFDEALAEMRATLGVARHFTVMLESSPIGMTSLKKLDREPGVGELSFWIGAPHHGRRFATAASRLTLAHGFETLGLARVDAHALLVANPASTAVLTRLRFTRAVRADEVAAPPFDLVAGDVWRFYELAACNWRIG